MPAIQTLGATVDVTHRAHGRCACSHAPLHAGFANQSVPLYLSEMAPFRHRGSMNILFQLCTTIGILAAQLINYAVQDWANGWRLSLGLAAVPAVVLFLGGIFLPESPNSLIERCARLLLTSDGRESFGGGRLWGLTRLGRPPCML